MKLLRNNKAGTIYFLGGGTISQYAEVMNKDVLIRFMESNLTYRLLPFSKIRPTEKLLTQLFPELEEIYKLSEYSCSILNTKFKSICPIGIVTRNPSLYLDKSLYETNHGNLFYGSLYDFLCRDLKFPEKINYKELYSPSPLTYSILGSGISNNKLFDVRSSIYMIKMSIDNGDFILFQIRGFCIKPKVVL